MKYYVYFLINPIDNKIFYVGKGTGERMFIHEKKARKGISSNNNSKLFNKINEIHKLGLSIVYDKIFESDNEFEAYEIELLEINRIGIENLTNITTTRIYNGVSSNVKLGLKNSEKNKNRLEYLKTEEYRNKCKAINLGEKNPFYGKKWNELQRKKIIESNKKPKTEEHKLKISNAVKGLTKTEEHRKNISAALRNSIKFYEKVRSDEYRKKQSKGSIGSNNGNAKTYIFISPDGKEFLVVGGFAEFCKYNNLGKDSMLSVKNGKKESHKGWKVYEKFSTLTKSN